MENKTQVKLDNYLTYTKNSSLISGNLLNDKFKGYHFKDVYVVNSLHEYVDFINTLLLDSHPTNKKDGNGKKLKWFRNKYYFRGISNINEMLPTLWRDDADKNREFEYISKFEENGSLMIGQFNNPIDLAAAAQHYGTKTRLLDWSYSPFIATLFSLFKKLDNQDNYYGLVFRSYEYSFLLRDLPLGEKYGESMSSKYKSTIDRLEKLLKDVGEMSIKNQNRVCSMEATNFVNEEQLELTFGIDKECVSNLLNYSKLVVNNTHPGISEDIVKEKQLKIARGIANKNRKLFIETNYSNERLRNQRGVFQICFSDYDPFYGNYLLLINPRARNEIIKYINRLGFNFYMLMNNPDNATKVINKTLNGDLLFSDEIVYENIEGKTKLPIVERKDKSN